MLKMNLITQEELWLELWVELYGELCREVNVEVCDELYRELDWESWELGSQIRIDFHNSKFRGYNTVC
jgi:hypothetical protein